MIREARVLFVKSRWNFELIKSVGIQWKLLYLLGLVKIISKNNDDHIKFIDFFTFLKLILSFYLLSLYTFDVRKFESPIQIHMDHVSAVTYVDYSPTGKEFVSGGYDKSIRIFDSHKVRFSCIKFLLLTDWPDVVKEYISCFFS